MFSRMELVGNGGELFYGPIVHMFHITADSVDSRMGRSCRFFRRRVTAGFLCLYRFRHHDIFQQCLGKIELEKGPRLR